MINITGYKEAEFEKYMVDKYGERKFKDGFLLIKMNMRTFTGKNGEEKLAEMLKPL